MKAIQVKNTIKGKDKSIARGVEYQFSNYIRENFPDLIKFTEDYYRWMEQDGGIINQIYSLPEILDISQTDAEYITYFAYEVMPYIPDDILIDKRLLIKHIRDMYVTKGTPSSVKFLFKLLFNENIEVVFPGEYVLRCSDGEWVKTTSIKTTSTTSIDILGRKIFGRESGAVAIVDKVTPTNLDSIIIDVIELSNLSGVFLIGEVIETRDDLQQYTSVVGGQIRTPSITTNGTGYSVGEIINLPDIAFQNGEIVVSDVDDTGAIIKLSINNTGFGYLSSFNITNANNKGANISIFVGAVYYDDGHYSSERGKLSSIMVLQDSLKYQDFSYVIQSTKSLDQYKTIMYNTVHPAGTLLLAEVMINGNKPAAVTSNNQTIGLNYTLTIGS